MSKMIRERLSNILFYLPLGHVLATMLIQILVGLLINNWWVGGMIGSVWYISREHTQAEYRWISKYGYGKRINMPWYGGFDYRVWDFKSYMDWAVPVVVSIIIYLLLR